MLKIKYVKLFFICALFSFYACSDDNTEENKIDQELIDALNQVSEGRGLSYFTLAHEEDFSNLPQDPSNPLTAEKIRLGKLLFHESAFSTEGEFSEIKGTYSCASCHHAGAGFQAGLAQGIGEGGSGFGVMGENRKRNPNCDAAKCDVQPIRSPTVLNGAYQEIMLWNGQFGATGLNTGTESEWTEDTPKAVNHLGFQGLETQAIAGLAVHRIGFSEEAVEANGYQQLFNVAFPNVSLDERFTATTAGLAIAAYERSITAYEAPFQKYLRGNNYALSAEEKQGALIFFGKGECYNCHTGPALNKMEFHAIGLNEFKADEVTHYNPEDPSKYGRYSFTQNEEDRYKFKTPQLYNLKNLEFLGHGASMHSIQEIIEYKNNAVAENHHISQNLLSPLFHPLNLTETEIEQLSAFIRDALYDPNLSRFLPRSLKSGNCFPNNDTQSRIDVGCD